jgi:hypothetical protein
MKSSAFLFTVLWLAPLLAVADFGLGQNGTGAEDGPSRVTG